jgi:eukaryotic-like serine/threonine-protein kinase
MPYVAGDSLRERLIRERQLPLSDTIEISRQVADALHFAHRQDLVDDARLALAKLPN